MRRLAVVLLVVFATVVPMRAAPAGAAAAAVCDMTGWQGYATPLQATSPPSTVGVTVTVFLQCVGLSPSFSLSATGSMIGSCAAETGNASITTPGVTGTMVWARVGLHDYFAIDFATGGSTYVFTGPTAWTPPGALDCVSPGVVTAGLHAVGPLAGV